MKRRARPLRTRTAVAACPAAAWALVLVAALLPAAAAPAAAGPREQTASVSAEVGAGDTYTARLGNLPAGAALSIRIESDAAVGVLLLDERGYRAFPQADRALFDGQAADSHRFSLRTPATGDYYLVIDNREGDSARAFTLAVTASRENGDTTGIEARIERVQAELDRFEQNLRRLFVFDTLDFQLRSCGSANTFAATDTVVICAELARRLLSGTDDREQARNILLFAVLHEFGHVVLRQWGYPFHENEEVADEFATVLLVMLGQGERARGLVDYFSSLSPDEELAYKRAQDDRHPLSIQRARNIAGWLDDAGLVRRWQKVLVPHLQTDVLQLLADRPEDWAVPELVEAELARRRGD